MIVVEIAGDRGQDAIGGRYRLIERLDRGGMGDVWRARDTTLARLVAIKQLHHSAQDMDTARRRFAHEARIAAALRSPHIVQIFDYGFRQDAPYLVMELLQGESLSARLARDERLTIETTCRIVEQIAAALTTAHAEGVIHRDLKPGNVFLCSTGSGRGGERQGLVKLLDFGIAKVTGGTEPLSAAPMTKSGTILGTPRYMSPEQLRCKTVDARADVWSLAVIVFECLCGRRPFEGDSLADLIMAISGDPIPVPSQLAEVPAGFDDWFRRGVSRDPAGRFASAAELAASLSALVTGVAVEPGLQTAASIRKAPLSAPAHTDESPPRHTPSPDDSSTWQEPMLKHSRLKQELDDSGTWQEPDPNEVWDPISGIVQRGAALPGDETPAENALLAERAADATSVATSLAEQATGATAVATPLAEQATDATSVATPLAEQATGATAVATSLAEQATPTPKRRHKLLPLALLCVATGGALALAIAQIDRQPATTEPASTPIHKTEPQAKQTSVRSGAPNVVRAAPAAAIDLKPVRGDTYQFSVPASWQLVELPIKTVAVAYRAPMPSRDKAQTQDGAAKVTPGVKLVVEAWEGTLSEYVDLGLDNLQDMGKVHHQQVTQAGPYPAIEVEISFHKVSRPYRSLKRVAVVNGMGYVMSCDGPIDDFDAIRSTCQRITASLRVQPRKP